MNKNKYLLLCSSAAVLMLLVWAAVEENYLREWRRIQAVGRSDEGAIPVQLRQVVNSNLGVSDRCVSCHVSMGPGEQSVRGSAILTAHKPVVHDPSEYGCTVCHGGQGLATERDDAHGDVHFWPEPMLDKSMSYAGCGTCHVALGVPEAAQLKAATLAFERLDCYACHRVDGKGGTVRPDQGGMEGPDLTRAGLVPYDADWHRKHVEKAKAAASGPWQTAFREVSDADLALVSVFLKTRVGAPQLIAAKSVFLSAGCYGCHKLSGVGGDDGPDMTRAGFKDPGQVSFEHVPGKGNMKNWMAEHFRAPASVVVGSQMPPSPLTEKEIEQLTFFTLSLRRKELRDVYLPKDRVQAAKFGAREFADDGATLYGAFCAGCHGADGQGRRLPGLLSFPSIANADFLPIAPDRLLAMTIEQGRPGRRMPGWLKPDGLRAEEIKSVTAYVRTLGGLAPRETDAKSPRWVEADASHGKRLFESTCAGCHGAQGKGGEGPALNNKVLLEAATDTYLMETISRGRRGTAMAGFTEPSPVRPALTRSDMEALIAYLRSMQGGKS
ncbi:MAG: c-type cytochrome [Bryobacterales bacterium]|nr:c-type cytochrome [Bryobacterales bacterium]